MLLNTILIREVRILHCLPDILSGKRMLKFPNDSLRQLLYLIIRSPFRNACKRMARRHINILIRLRAWNMKFHWKIRANTDDNIPVPNLRNAVFLSFIKMYRQLIAALLHIGKNLLEITGSCSTDTGDILCNKPEWFKHTEHFYTVPIETTELFILHPLMFADTGKGITRKAISKCIDWIKLLDVQLPNIFTDYTVRIIRANIIPICSAGISVYIIRPDVLHIQKTVTATGVKSAVSETTRTTVKLPKTECIFCIKISHYLSSFSTQYWSTHSLITQDTFLPINATYIFNSQ